MDLKEVLSAVESNNYTLELNIDTSVPEDVVIWGALTEKAENPTGRDRREFAFRGEEQVEFLNGIGDLLSKPRIA